MVAVYAQKDHKRQVVLSPNQSLDFKGNVLVVVAVSFTIFLSAVPIAIMGGWVVLPFAVVQILALSTGLYVTLMKLNYKEVITLENGQIILQRGHKKIESSFSFPEKSVKILVEDQEKPMYSPDIDMVVEGHCYHLGDFLNRSDRFILAHILKNQLNLRISRHSSFHHVSF